MSLFSRTALSPRGLYAATQCTPFLTRCIATRASETVADSIPTPSASLEPTSKLPPPFVPRQTFEASADITRSYFLGHHKEALDTMSKTLSSVDLIIECRDSRAPLTCTNPLFEKVLAGRDRIIVFTKSDLRAPRRSDKETQRLEDKKKKLLEAYCAGDPQGGMSRADGSGERPGATQALFSHSHSETHIRRLFQILRQRAKASDSLTGVRALVVGMPNVGKSTLLNALREMSMEQLGQKQKRKVAQTGSQPGITRKLSTPVNIIPASPDNGIMSSLYIMDTPGVFIPYVSDVESMLKLSLIGCVKDGVVPIETVADYLLFHMNLRDPSLYADLSPPTNSAQEFLENIARRTGKLKKGGVPKVELVANWIISRWRGGKLGLFSLDDITEESLQVWGRDLAERKQGGGPVSMNQARKMEKEKRKAYKAAKQAILADPGQNR